MGKKYVKIKELTDVINEVRVILEKMYLTYRNDDEVILLSKLLDDLIYIEMRNRLAKAKNENVVYIYPTKEILLITELLEKNEFLHKLNQCML